jgi:alpha-N-arabinofuranosidase
MAAWTSPCLLVWIGVLVLLASQATAALLVTITVDASKLAGPINPDIYGQYLEHVDAQDECIYPSIWDDTSGFADARGLRTDVAEAARDLGVPITRWPGGCFADVYRWENGIGPREQRPTLTNGYYRASRETHQFGTDEFLHWCELLRAKPYINVNLGSGTLDEALRWLEYCNGPADSPQGQRRAANGRAEPYQVRHWGIGNETWGPWEVGHSDAPTYAANLRTWAEAMKAQDPSIKVLGVGSSTGSDPAWDNEVLDQAGHLIDYLTFHIYGHSTNTSGEEFDAVVFTPHHIESRLAQMLGTIDAWKARTGSTRDIQVSVDEWNIRHYDVDRLRRRDPRNMQDALFVAGVLNVMIRQSPRVGMANYVFLVNGHAPLLVDRETVVRTPLFHVFRQYARWMTGRALRVEVAGPKVIAPAPMRGAPPKAGAQSPATMGPTLEVPYVDATAAVHDDGTVVLAIVNRHRTDTADVTLNLPPGMVVRSAWTLRADTPYVVNDFENPNRVMPVEAEVEQSVTGWSCPPASVTLLRCQRPVR